MYEKCVYERVKECLQQVINTRISGNHELILLDCYRRFYPLNY